MGFSSVADTTDLRSNLPLALSPQTTIRQLDELTLIEPSSPHCHERALSSTLAALASRAQLSLDHIHEADRAAERGVGEQLGSAYGLIVRPGLFAILVHSLGAHPEDRCNLGVAFTSSHPDQAVAIREAGRIGPLLFLAPEQASGCFKGVGPDLAPHSVECEQAN